MNRNIALLLLVLLLAGCGQKSLDESALPEDESEGTDVPDSVWVTGQKAYNDICADCHEEGLNGAPKTGDRDAWEGRSWLWEAVLFEHARNGLQGMPAKGGDATLDDATVTKAAEYMLMLTFPEMPRG